MKCQWNLILSLSQYGRHCLTTSYTRSVSSNTKQSVSEGPEIYWSYWWFLNLINSKKNPSTLDLLKFFSGPLDFELSQVTCMFYILKPFYCIAFYSQKIARNLLFFFFYFSQMKFRDLKCMYNSMSFPMLRTQAIISLAMR